ncbi:MAG: hypothetical protein J5I92_00155 [Thiogranum sp.]|nr:hypothetical protein [Thiogranum sp.]
MSRGTRRSFPAGLAEHAALSLFNVGAAAADLPVAPLRYLGEFARKPAGWCLNADPVHLRADTHGLILFDAAALAITDAERDALATTLAPYFEEYGCSLETGSAQHWYLTAQAAEELVTTPLAQVVGQSVDRYLPRGRNAADWLRRSNEIQMLLHAHPVNQQRAAKGSPAINSVWLWGGGLLPARGAAGFTRICSGDPFIKGLARLHETECVPLPADLQELGAALQPGDAVLVTLDETLRPALYSDAAAWNEAIENAERNWFAPALEALSRRRITHLELLPLDGYRYRVRAGDLWRLWRRLRSYRDILIPTVSV